MKKSLEIVLLISVASFLFLNNVNAQNNPQEGSLKYFTQLVINDLHGDQMTTDIKQVWKTIPGKLMEVPVAVEKNHKYAIGVAGDYWVNGVQFRVLNEKSEIITSISTAGKEEEKNIETIYFQADKSGQYTVQVMLNSTTGPDAMLAMIMGER